MRYETHITFPGARWRKTRRLAKDGWKFSRMKGDPVLGSKTFCYLTSYNDSYGEAIRLAHIQASLASKIGVMPLRIKVEQEVYDERLVETQPEAY